MCIDLESLPFDQYIQYGSDYCMTIYFHHGRFYTNRCEYGCNYNRYILIFVQLNLGYRSEHRRNYDKYYPEPGVWF